MPYIEPTELQKPFISEIGADVYIRREKCVYIIQSGEFCKIGYTSNLGKRIDSLKTGNPYELKLQFVLYTDFPKEIENELHNLFKDKHYFREWFKMDNKDILEAANYIEKTRYLKM